jgi:hypothetical protein
MREHIALGVVFLDNHKYVYSASKKKREGKRRRKKANPPS